MTAVRGHEPTYLMLAADLERLVAASPPGGRLPSEHELMERHGVSRLTARAALQELERRHLVRRIRGSGTFVARRVECRLTGDLPATVAGIVARSGAEPFCETLAVRSCRPSQTVRAALELAPQARVVEATQRDYADGQVASVTIASVPSEFAPGLAYVGNGDGPPTDLPAALRRHFGLAPRRARLVAELKTVPDGVAGLLDLEGRPLVWHVLVVSECTRRKRPVLIEERWMRPDVFRVVAEMRGR